MTKSYAGKLSVTVLGLSLALAMLFGTAVAKDAQPKERKRARARVKKNADGAKPKQRKGGQSSRLKAINAIVAELTAELNLTKDQKVRVEEIIKKHLKARGARKGKDKAPGDAKRPRGKKGGGKNRERKKKGKGAAKGNTGPGIDRF